MPPTTNESDSDDDLDYIPPPDDNDSDSSDGYEQAESETTSSPPDPEEQRKQRDALWATFQASLSTPPANANSTTLTPSQAQAQAQSHTQSSAVKQVKIEKTYLFAGKHVTEVVDVPEDSDDAKKWPRWSPCPRATSNGVDGHLSGERDDEKDRAEDKDEGRSSCSASRLPPSSSVDSLSPLPPPPTTTTLTPGEKRPGPRKPRTTLPAISKALQPKKITTLDKSAMDWRVHVATQSGDVKDELDANKRGGGYLEKVDFLKRVQERREEAFEASKLNKRRKT